MGRTAHLAAFAGPSRRDRELAEEALARLGLSRLADAIYTRISGGERQLTLIARALAQAAPLLVMDEPTASLDFGNQVRVLDQVMSLARSGIGVLLSTHDPDQAFQCADRVALLRGRAIAQGSPGQVLTRERLRELYGVDVEVAEASLSDGTRRRVRLTAGTSPAVTGAARGSRRLVLRPAVRELADIVELPLQRQALEPFEPQRGEEADPPEQDLVGDEESARICSGIALDRGGIGHAPVRRQRLAGPQAGRLGPAAWSHTVNTKSSPGASALGELVPALAAQTIRRRRALRSC